MMTQRIIAYFTWILPLPMILCPVQVYGVDSFCIADTIPLGGSGRVSCHFNEDLSKVPQKDVCLYRVSNSDPELVVYYSWVNGQPRNFTEPGYGCASELTDHLEILIDNATSEHAGLYKCVVNPPKGLNQKTCTLTIQEGPEKAIDSNSKVPSSHIEDQGIESSCTASSVSVGEKGLITFRFTEDLSLPPPKDLTVFLHKESDTEPTLVLLYAWNNGSPRIEVTPGYICNGKLTDQLQIAVNNATIQHTGLYQSVIHHSKHRSISCMFHVEEERSADITQIYNHIVPILMGSLVLLATIILILITVFRLRPQRWNNSSRTTESPSESAKYFIAEGKPLQGNNGLDV